MPSPERVCRPLKNHSVSARGTGTRNGRAWCCGCGHGSSLQRANPGSGDGRSRVRSPGSAAGVAAGPSPAPPRAMASPGPAPAGSVTDTQWPTAAHSRTPGVEQTAHTMNTKRSRCSGPPASQNTGLCSRRRQWLPGRARLPGAPWGGGGTQDTGEALRQDWLLTGSRHLPQSWALLMLWLQSWGDRRNPTPTSSRAHLQGGRRATQEAGRP